MKKNKKFIFIALGVIVALVLVIVGILLFMKISTERREKDFETAAKQYYDSYMSGLTGADEAYVTLEMLERVVNEKDEKYEIKSLKKCDTASSMTFTIENQKITKQVMDLKCN